MSSNSYLGWNPWHGCHKYSPGCKYCYVYRTDSKYDKDSSVVTRTSAFDLPVKRKRNGEYKLAPANGEVMTCFTSDFFVEDADQWREEAWRMIAERNDLTFVIFTKRIERFSVCLPDDWGDGYDNVVIGCTVENQECADRRLPIFNSLPIRHRMIICAPLIGPIDLERHIGDRIFQLAVSGESGLEARVCDYDWVVDLRRQCVAKGVPFTYYHTGARLMKNGKLYRIPRRFQHVQAKKANLDTPLRDNGERRNCQ